MAVGIFLFSCSFFSWVSSVSAALVCKKKRETCSCAPFIPGIGKHLLSLMYRINISRLGYDVYRFAQCIYIMYAYEESGQLIVMKRHIVLSFEVIILQFADLGIICRDGFSMFRLVLSALASALCRCKDN